MGKPMTIRISRRGALNLPKALRDRYSFQPGCMVTMLDLDGVILITPRRLEVDRLADKIGSALSKRGESLESMLTALREERKK